jgi:thiamine biosynthesis lipoprotein
VLVSLGGDIAAAGDSPLGGWPVLIADDHRQSERCGSPARPVQVVRMTGGGLATSSIGCRQWTRAGQALHHIIDPRTARSADGPWRTVSVAAATCADANAAATAAIISGAEAEAWLADRGIPARLVGQDGSVRHVGGWPGRDGGQLPLPSTRWLPLPAAGGRP